MSDLEARVDALEKHCDVAQADSKRKTSDTVDKVKRPARGADDCGCCAGERCTCGADCPCKCSAKGSQVGKPACCVGEGWTKIPGTDSWTRPVPPNEMASLPAPTFYAPQSFPQATFAPTFSQPFFGDCAGGNCFGNSCASGQCGAPMSFGNGGGFRLFGGGGRCGPGGCR